MRNILIFLDIDGVLNKCRTINTYYQIEKENAIAFATLCQKLMSMGLTVEVVLSSTWRRGYDDEYERCSLQVKRLIQTLNDIGVQIIGKTPDYYGKTRDVEIMRYVREYELKHENFKIITLDDDRTIFDEEGAKKVNLYITDWKKGLCFSDIKKILKGLKRSK